MRERWTSNAGVALLGLAALVSACASLAGITQITGVDAGDNGDDTDGGSSGGVSSGSASGGGSSTGGGSDSGSGSSSGGSSSGATSAAASCVTIGTGTSMCGLAGDSCCTSIEVPGGAYNRTYTNTDGGPMNEADPATVSGFRLDKYLVTVGRFAQFVTAWDNGSGWTPPAGSGKHTHLNGGNGLADSGNPGSYEPGWQTSDDVNIAPTSTNLDCSPGYSTWGNAANLPITCVNWYEAYAFCIWDGGFLPSEAEWEFAAAGGSEELEYPWGTTDPDTSCMGPGCEYAIYGCYYPGGSGNCSGVSNIAPVGTATLGIGRWNQLDLAGDAWEWNLDYYAPYVDPCTDCAYLATAPNRVVRGGVFNGAESYLLPPGRGFVGPPTSRDGGVGFRCARTP